MNQLFFPADDAPTNGVAAADALPPPARLPPPSSHPPSTADSAAGGSGGNPFGAAPSNPFGATPSSAQTTQYLLRNEILAQLGELRDELQYQQSISIEKRESDVAVEALQKCLKAFDEYITLAPTEERKLAQEAVYGSSSSS